MRRLHRAGGRQAGLLVQLPRRLGRRPNSVDGRGPYQERQARSAAGSVHRARRSAVRLLHVGSADVGQGAPLAHAAAHAGRCADGACGQSLSLLQLQPHRRSGSGRRRRRLHDAHAGRWPVSQQSNAGDRTGVNTMKVIGHATPRIDAPERVSGRATYTRDVYLDGMLYAQVLRSPHPHARIKAIDLSKARALPGVKAIVTHENCHYVWGAGSIAAAVAAVDRHVAEEAVRLITVDYEVLPFVLDQEAALKDDAIKIWPEGNISPDARNQFQPTVQKHGNVEDGFKNADRVFEARYSTVMCHNAQMEPRSCVAHWEGDKLTVYTPTGGIANCHHDIARDLGIPDEKVRVICHYMGGNFGNKNQNQDADLITAVLAREAGAPVKLEFSRKDDFIGMHGRWPTIQYYKVGVKNDGRLTAIQLRTISNMGPYRKNSGAVSGIELYDCDHTESTLFPTYTNRTTSANFRGPSDPQGYYPIQSHMDDIAYAMKMDPVDFILKNMVKPGPGAVFTNYTLDECVRRGAELFEWKKRWSPPCVI